MPNTPIGVPLLYLMLHLRRESRGAILPPAKAVNIPKYGHNNPDISGAEKVAALIRA